MLKINTKISTLALACLLLGAGSCARKDDVQSGGNSGDKLLQVNVQMATSPMLTRGATASPIISDTIDMGNDLVLVASSRSRDYEPEEALTRGTPIKSAATLPSMNVKVYNSGADSFSGSTALTTTLKGTNSSGAWSLSPSYAIVDDVKNTYMAYSPIEDAGNGITVAANGRTLTYTAPATVTNHPDLCTSTIVKDDVSGTLSLAMQHRLAAVGIKVSADNVTINEIKLENIKNSGALNLETGAYSGWAGSANFSPTLTTTTPSTAGAMNDITAGGGYLMLPPQTFTADNQTIIVKFTYAGGAQETATYKLKDLTGGKWDAGQIVMYEIQLKAKFSLTFSPISQTLTYIAGKASFTYSTNSPSAGDPQFTNKDGVKWITNLAVNRSTKTVSFNYDANTLASARTAAIKATSGWTEQDISIKQLNDPDFGSYIPRSVLVTVWPISRLPVKGLQLAMRGDKVKPGGTPAANDPTRQFKTDRTYTDGTSTNAGAGKNNTALLTGVEHPAAQYCRDMGAEWYLPSSLEWEIIRKNMDALVAGYHFSATEVWSSVDIRASHATCISLDGGSSNILKDLFRTVRCVREI